MKKYLNFWNSRDFCGCLAAVYILMVLVIFLGVEMKKADDDATTKLGTSVPSFHNKPGSYEISRVNRVIDGDTFVATINLGFGVSYDASIRIIGIDAPETRGVSDAEKERGRKAKEHLEKLLTTQQSTVYITVDSKRWRDSFGRVLGEIWIKDLSIGEQMVIDNHAVYYEK